MITKFEKYKYKTHPKLNEEEVELEFYQVPVDMIRELNKNFYLYKCDPIDRPFNENDPYNEEEFDDDVDRDYDPIKADLKDLIYMEDSDGGRELKFLFEYNGTRYYSTINKFYLRDVDYIPIFRNTHGVWLYKHEDDKIEDLSDVYFDARFLLNIRKRDDYKYVGEYMPNEFWKDDGAINYNLYGN